MHSLSENTPNMLSRSWPNILDPEPTFEQSLESWREQIFAIPDWIREDETSLHLRTWIQQAITFKETGPSSPRLKEERRHRFWRVVDVLVSAGADWDYRPPPSGRTNASPILHELAWFCLRTSNWTPVHEATQHGATLGDRSDRSLFTILTRLAPVSHIEKMWYDADPAVLLTFPEQKDISFQACWFDRLKSLLLNASQRPVSERLSLTKAWVGVAKKSNVNWARPDPEALQDIFAIMLNAEDVEVMDFLVQEGMAFDVHADASPKYPSWTWLHVVVTKGLSASCAWLLAQGADPERLGRCYEDGEMISALDMAQGAVDDEARKQVSEVLSLLERHVLQQREKKGVPEQAVKSPRQRL